MTICKHRAHDLCTLVALLIPDYCMFVFLPMRNCVSLCQCVPILMVHCVKAILCIICWHFAIVHHHHHPCHQYHDISVIVITITFIIIALQPWATGPPFLWLGNWPFLVRISFRQPELRISTSLHARYVIFLSSDIKLLVNTEQQESWCNIN